MFFIKRCEMRSIYRLPLNIDPVVSLLIGSSVNIAFSFLNLILFFTVPGSLQQIPGMRDPGFAQLTESI